MVRTSKKTGERRVGAKRSKPKGRREKSLPKRAAIGVADELRGSPASDIKSLARIYAPGAMRELARLSVEAQSETARISAIDKILDRAHGPIRATAGNMEKPLEIIVGVSASLDAKLDRIAHAIAAGSAQG